jgi:hypothetical protein
MKKLRRKLKKMLPRLQQPPRRRKRMMKLLHLNPSSPLSSSSRSLQYNHNQLSNHQCSQHLKLSKRKSQLSSLQLNPRKTQPPLNHLLSQSKKRMKRNPALPPRPQSRSSHQASLNPRSNPR